MHKLQCVVKAPCVGQKCTLRNEGWITPNCGDLIFTEDTPHSSVTSPASISAAGMNVTLAAHNRNESESIPSSGHLLTTTCD